MQNGFWTDVKDPNKDIYSTTTHTKRVFGGLISKRSMTAKCSLNHKEEPFWKSILCDTIEEMASTSPNKPTYQATEEAWKRFNSLRWVALTSNKDVEISQEDYKIVNEAFGPDLNAIPRTRYSALSKSGSSGAKKKLNSYSIFTKEMMTQLKGEKGAMKQIGEKWRNLTEQEKEIYAQKAEEANNKQ